MSCRQHPCGAKDCVRCFPTCNDPTECCSCGATVPQHATIECRRCGNAVCEACADDGMCVECHRTHDDEARLKRACDPRKGDVFRWRDNVLTVTGVSANGVVSTLLECENWCMDATLTHDSWVTSVKRTLERDDVTFVPALDTDTRVVV